MKKMLFSLLLVTGSYAAMAQSDAKFAEGPIKLYGQPATYLPDGAVACGTGPELCATIGKIFSSENKPSVLLKIYVGGESQEPLEIEAKRFLIQEVKNRKVIRFEE